VIVEGRAVSIAQDNVDTDVLYPGPYLNIQDPEQMKDHLCEGLDPALRSRLGEGTILLVRENFGCGSSREHVPQAMRALGIRCLVGRSFARIFYRNCLNLGLLAVTCPEIEPEGLDGERVRIDTESGEVSVGGRRFQARPLPSFVLDMVEAGGLVASSRSRLERDSL
jgi:3-isopropylmalate/(R)-2-methylmalate dehydratase small subunit